MSVVKLSLPDFKFLSIKPSSPGSYMGLIPLLSFSIFVSTFNGFQVFKIARISKFVKIKEIYN